ncbi:MAG: hypothetical protein KKF44_05045 [Nanoarchaeota archaeon]|nr:hypothetical protein [Nanoarchaeota archaeon]
MVDVCVSTAWHEYNWHPTRFQRYVDEVFPIHEDKGLEVFSGNLFQDQRPDDYILFQNPTMNNEFSYIQTSVTDKDSIFRALEYATMVIHKIQENSRGLHKGGENKLRGFSLNVSGTLDEILFGDKIRDSPNAFMQINELAKAGDNIKIGNEKCERYSISTVTVSEDWERVDIGF